LSISIIPPWAKVAIIRFVLAATYGAGELRRALADAKELGAKDQQVAQCATANAGFVANEKAARDKGAEVQKKLDAAQTLVGTLALDLLARDRRRPRLAPAADCDVREQYARQESAKVLAAHRRGPP
jgi:hypothetical protein